MTLEVYADICCPFAHVSLRTLRPLRDELAPSTPIVVRAWPLELVNGRPLDPALTATHVDELRRDVAPGLFSDFDPATMPHTTLKALALVEAANDADPWIGEELSIELRDTLYERGTPIDDDLVYELARRAGLDPSVVEDSGRVEARWAAGRAAGVKGSPHFFLGPDQLFCPLLDIERDAGGGLHMRERLDRLEGFLRDGLAP